MIMLSRTEYQVIRQWVAPNTNCQQARQVMNASKKSLYSQPSISQSP